MKTQLFIYILVSIFSLLSLAEEPVLHLKTLNAEFAKAAVLSYSEGHFRFIQEGKLIEASDVDAEKASCILETGKFIFNPDALYKLESTRQLDVDEESGEIELNFETQSADSESYFQMYCYQGAPSANLDTAREALKNIFEIQ